MTQTLPEPGTVARFDLTNGDSYIGEIVHINGGLVTVQNYSVWYAVAAAPYSSPYVDDSARFQIDDKTRVSAF